MTSYEGRLDTLEEKIRHAESWKEKYEKDVPGLEARVSELESMLAEAEARSKALERFEPFVKAIDGLFPRVPVSSDLRVLESVSLTPAVTEVVVKSAGVQVVDVSAVESMAGKILQVIFEDGLSADGRQFLFSEISRGLSDRGWRFGNANINSGIADLIKRGLLFKEQKGRYRLPSRVKFVLGGS